MKKSVLMILTAVFFMTVGCKTKEEVVEKDQRKPVAKLTVVEPNWEIPEYHSSVTIDTVMIQGNIMSMLVTYSGGCEKHEFELVTSKIYMKSLPPKLNINLIHNGNGDNCRELITETLQFDISEAQYPNEKNREVRLIIASGEKTQQRASYKY